MVFKAFAGDSQSSEVNNFTNQLAIQCHPELISILPPPTSHPFYVYAAFPSHGLSSLAQEQGKPHANNQPDWQTVSWKKRTISETAGSEGQSSHISRAVTDSVSSGINFYLDS